MSDIWPMCPLILLVVAVHMSISNLTNYYYCVMASSDARVWMYHCDLHVIIL